ncbi:hypothetical protein ACTFIR_011368 [Dictyostelium discoideum]
MSDFEVESILFICSSIYRGSSSISGDDGSNYNNKNYITQVDTILRELFQQLSFNICTNVSNRDELVDGKDFFNHSLNADLKFSLDIGKKDLFWEFLDWIEQYMIKNENLMKHQVYQFDSPYESLLPTSTIFSNVNIIKKELPSPPTTTTIESTFLKIDNFEKPIPNELTIKVTWNSDKLIEPFKPISKLINSFKFSDSVMGSISIKKIIEILIDQFSPSANDDDENPDQNFASIIKNNRVSFIQSNIEQPDTQLNFKSALDQILLKSKEDEINSPFIENIKNPFLQSFIFGDIKTCNLILKYYPNQFKITKDSITETLKMQNIHIIKYYYKVDNCKNLINNFKNDNNLLKHLKNELSKHPTYKYHLTWL